MICASLLFHEKPDISFRRIKETSDNMYWKIIQKGKKTYCSNSPQNFDINNVVKHLDFKVNGKVESKTTKVNIRQHLNHNVKMLSMSHYVNPLVSCFHQEAMMVHAVFLEESRIAASG